MTAAAQIIGCTELNEQAVVATDNFPGIYRGKSCGHLGFGSSQSVGTPGASGQAPNLKVIWGTWPVDVKGFLGKTRNEVHESRRYAAKNRRKQGRIHE